MKTLLLGVPAALAAAFTLAATGGAAPLPVAGSPAAERPAPAVQPAPATSTYTWTRTDESGRVVFTRSGTLGAGKTSFGDTGQPVAGQPVAGQPIGGPPVRGIGIDACCSPSGCDAVDVVRDVGSLIFGSSLARFHHRVYWCWSYPRITGVNVSCYASDIKGWLGVIYHGCDGGGSYYTWAGSGQGGHYSYRQGSFQQCAFDRCTTYRYPWISIWVNGNGAWAQDQGG